jgi:ribose/xylose/arabinose/galactoside ABC-type transport system permease subunit
LGSLTALRGLATWTMGGRNIDDLPEGLTQVTKYGFFGIPLSVWTVGFVIGVTWLLLYHTSVGTRVFAVGSSPFAARMVGVSERPLKLFVFGYAGLLTAVATVVDVPRLPTIESGIGVGLELLVVTCVVVGGTSISGGRGTLSGVLLAVLLMTMVRPVLTFMDVGAAGEKWAKAIQGAFIVMAIIADSVWNRRPVKGISR